MFTTKRSVTVHTLPRETSPESQMQVLASLENAVESGHPRFVVDCSNLETVGSEEVHLLLCCLEEAMKHNGDVRLAELKPKAYAALRNIGIGRLFEIFDTKDAAVASYEGRQSHVPALTLVSPELGTEYAA